MARSLSNGLGVEFDFALQDGFINERGTAMIHETAIKCPVCIAEDTFAGMLNDGEQRRGLPFCNSCSNTNWLYRNPKIVIGLVTNIRHQKNILDAGEATGADLTFSPLIQGDDEETHVGAYDKLTATWAEPLDDGQVIVRGAGTMGENARLSTNLASNEDRLWYEPHSALWCEDQNGTVYREGSDFTLGPGKVITWVGNKPIVGYAYTIKYKAFCEWISWRPPTERLDRDRNLGQLVFLRKKHTVFVNSPLAADGEKLSLQSSINC